MPPYFPVNCKQQGRLRQFCLLPRFWSFLVVPFRGRNSPMEGRQNQMLGGDWKPCKGSSTIHSFLLQAGSWQYLAPRLCTYQWNHQNWGQAEQQTSVVTKPQPLRSTASKLQTKPTSSEHWGREILSSTGLFGLLAHKPCRLSCQATLHWQSLQKTHTWNIHDFLTGKKEVNWGERDLCILADGKDKVKNIRIRQPVSPAPVQVPGEALEARWIKKESTLAAHSWTELWWIACPPFIDEWLLQAHRCAENYKSCRKQRDIGTSPGRGISWGQMLISARNETYKWGVCENVVRRGKNGVQETVQ